MNKSTIPTPQKAALSLLLDDHRNAKKLFKQFKEAGSDAEKEEIAQTVCRELTVHTMLEEEIFYPLVRREGGQPFADLLDEAIVEHASAKDLIAQIQAMHPNDEMYDARVTVLGEYINHHVKEEEEELFPKIVGKKIDLREAADMMAARKEELMGTVPA
ncbi:hemerythrin domain-containing protein [Pigmentiphaga sp. H8]|uniref:hemerythrin domain-containing protein n=1 Tax=Pigmentiphaga sp. H8 TaxID=2488560 RepID=UPI000F5B2419|nr:hemerythrin domain-containing protein [Pigmentiphaga sp. H8]AZG07746.1 hemerythrin domain-containing protein [Pigmentiphaga sp. H8]